MPRDDRGRSRSRSRSRSQSPRRRKGYDSRSDNYKTSKMQESPGQHSASRLDPSPRREKYHRARSRSAQRDRRRYSRSRSRSRGRDFDSRPRSRSPPRKKRRSRSRSVDSRRHNRERRSRSRSMSRSRSRDRREHRKRRARSRSSFSESDDESRRKKDKKKDSESKRSKSKERRKDKKKDKKDKKKHGPSSSHWGKYGVITETDIFTKSAEFHTWLVEERKINPETISKDQSKKEFAKFVEDFNTATLPHEKYYNMEAYDRRMSALRSGEFVPPSDDKYDPEADLKAINSAHKKRGVDQESYLTREQLMELRKVQNERIEAGKMKLLGMEIKQNMGVRMDGTSFE